MFSIDVVASAPDDRSLLNVFHIRKYVMHLTQVGPIVFGGNIYTNTLGLYVQFFKFAPKPKNLHNLKTLPLIQM